VGSTAKATGYPGALNLQLPYLAHAAVREHPQGAVYFRQVPRSHAPESQTLAQGLDAVAAVCNLGDVLPAGGLTPVHFSA